MSVMYNVTLFTQRNCDTTEKRFSTDTFFRYSRTGIDFPSFIQRFMSTRSSKVTVHSPFYLIDSSPWFARDKCKYNVACAHTAKTTKLFGKRETTVPSLR